MDVKNRSEVRQNNDDEVADGNNLDSKVEEAVRKLVQGGKKFVPRGSKRRRMKSLPGSGSSGRFYDWNTTHFFPDLHEVNIGLTFEVPNKSGFDGVGYFAEESRNSAPTFISVSRESSSADLSHSGFKANPTLEKSKRPDNIFKVPVRMDSVDSEEDDFVKIWMRSPVVNHRQNRREDRPSSSKGLPPKWNPYNFIHKFETTPPRLVEDDLIKIQTQTAQMDSPGLNHINLEDVCNYPRKQSVVNHNENKLVCTTMCAETNINRAKALSLENLCDTNVGYLHKPSNLSKMSEPLWQMTAALVDESAERSSEQKITIRHIGSCKGEPLKNEKLLDGEEEKLKCQGYEVDDCSVYEQNQRLQHTEPDAIPPDVYVLKKVRRNPTNMVQCTSRNSVNEIPACRIPIKDRVEFIPNRKKKLNSSEVEQVEESNKITFRSCQTVGNLSNTSNINDFASCGLPKCKEMFQNFETKITNTAMVVPSFEKTQRISLDHCTYKPPRPPRDIRHGIAPKDFSDPSLALMNQGFQLADSNEKNIFPQSYSDSAAFLNSQINRRSAHFANMQRPSFKVLRDGYFSGSELENSDETSTVFSLTGYPSNALPGYNYDRSSLSTTSDLAEVSNFGGQPYYMHKHNPTRNISRNIDLRRQPISRWLELGNDLEYALSSGNYSDTSDIQILGIAEDSTLSTIQDFDYPESGQVFFHNSEEIPSRNEYQQQYCKDAVALIFDAIDQQSHSYLTSSAATHKAQDRHEDLIFLDLHTNSESGSCQDQEKMDRRATLPSNFVPPTESLIDAEYAAALTCLTDSRSKFVDQNAAKMYHPLQHSQSLPGSKHNLCDYSDDDNDQYQQFTVAEIKAKLFGPNEEKAEHLLLADSHHPSPKFKISKKNSDIVGLKAPLASSGITNGNYKRLSKVKGQIEYYKKHQTSSPSSDGDNYNSFGQNCFCHHQFHKFGQRLTLQEVPSESLGSLARKEEDDMAIRRYQISRKWNTMSNPDLSQREYKHSPRIQTSYPRKTSKGVLKEKMPKASKSNKVESINNSTYSSSHEHSNICSSIGMPEDNKVVYNQTCSDGKSLVICKTNGPLSRRQSLGGGVAKLVNLFEKSSSAPNIFEDNLFANSYSESGDVLVNAEVNVDGQDGYSSKTPSKPYCGRHKKIKKVKIHLLKSSDSGYIESETDSISSSGREFLVKNQNVDHADSKLERKGVDDTCKEEERYDKEKRWHDLRQLKETWLSAPPSNSQSHTSHFVSRKILPLSSKDDHKQEFCSKAESIPYYERTCKVTSFGPSTFSAFDKVSKPPQFIISKKATNVEKKNSANEHKLDSIKGLSALVSGNKSKANLGKHDAVLGSTFPSGFVPLRGGRGSRATPFNRNQSDKFEFSDDGNLTDCTDVTIDAILAPNQLSTLSPSSTIDFSDFELYQASVGLSSLGGSPKNQNIQFSGIQSKVTAFSPKADQPSRYQTKGDLSKKMLSENLADVRDDRRKSIKELVDSFEVLTSYPFIKSRPTIST